MMILAVALWAQGSLPDALAERYTGVVETVAPAVVAIYAERPPVAVPSEMEAFIPPPGAPVTGLVVRPEGLIVTTAYNVRDIRGAPRVRLADGREFEGEVVGWNAPLDLALLRIDAGGLPTLRPADPGRLHPGRTVAAVGIGADGRSVTIHPGVLSAPSRVMRSSVQHDARIHFGNVGGPLVDLEGRLIGMTCRLTGESLPFEGIGSGVSYAVLWFSIDAELPSLAAGRAVRGGQLGVHTETVPGVGARIVGVAPGSAAERAGLRGNDVIHRFDGQAVESSEGLRRLLWSRNPGDRVRVEVRREEREMTFEVELGERS